MGKNQRGPANHQLLSHVCRTYLPQEIQCIETMLVQHRINIG